MKIIVIGGGAAGFFAALSAAAHHPDAQVIILEKTSKLLSKVKVSGGGRCNVTHACYNPVELSRFYPRGEKSLKSAFGHFMTTDTIHWFETRGVKLKTEEDGRMFPLTDDSQTIIDCLLREARMKHVEIRLQTDVVKTEPQQEGGFLLTLKSGSQNNTLRCDRLIIATGGSPKESGFDWLKALGHRIEKPVPSLFTFNMPGNPVTNLMGVSVPHARVKIQGTKLVQEGALLITHWGMSGPAVLKLSAWGARVLHDLNYHFSAHVNWLPGYGEEQMREKIQQLRQEIATRQIANKNPFELPKRLWEFLLEKIEIPAEKRWTDLAKADVNRLVNALVNDVYEVRGKTTFKEEFVTCGGVSLQDVDFKTMQSRHCPGLFFAGEVLDIDGITGGFNFQAAWTTGYLAGRAAGNEQPA